MLHGSHQYPTITRQSYHWDELAAEEGFAVAYPQGIALNWNGGDCCAAHMPARGVA